MPKIKYVWFNQFTSDYMAVIRHANRILEEYAAQGFVLTLRQLYYQFVSRDLIPNEPRQYQRLVKIMSKARLAGLVDWDYLVDRTRNLQRRTHFKGPKDAFQDAVDCYHIDLWKRQRVRPEVWIEKDALIGVIEGACHDLDVPFFSCRGYNSLSEMWRASQRLNHWFLNGQEPYIIHLGDHDPSGCDMSRDIFDRMEVFLCNTKFHRVALNMDQIEQYEPPPNPAKVTDSRWKTYTDEHGESSWELDALEPRVLIDLIRDTVATVRDDALWEEDVARKEAERAAMQHLVNGWDPVATGETHGPGAGI